MLAAAEISFHPATALILGGIVAGILRGRYASAVMVIAPILGLWLVSTMEVGATSTMVLFGQEIINAEVDRQAILFGYLFSHSRPRGGTLRLSLARSLATFHGIALCGNRRGRSFCGRLDIALPLVGRGSPSLRCSKYGVAKPNGRNSRVFATCFSMFPRACFF